MKETKIKEGIISLQKKEEYNIEEEIISLQKKRRRIIQYRGGNNFTTKKRRN